MADNFTPDNNSEGKRKFIKESIGKNSPKRRRQLLDKGLKLVLAAVIFGVVATFTSVLSSPIIKRLTGSDTPKTATYKIPKDEPEETDESKEAAAGEETVGESTEQALDENDIKIELKKAFAEYQYAAGDISKMSKALARAGIEYDKSIVTIHSTRTEKDWFDNSIEQTGVYTGIIINKSDGELIILAPEAALSDAENIRVTIKDKDYEAALRRTDSLSFLAVVAVSTEGMDEKEIEGISPIELGNSYSISRGDLVLAVGSPYKIPYSLGVGMVSYISNNVSVVDASISLLYTDVALDGEYGTWILDLDGKLVGWVCEANQSDMVDTAIITGISEYKPILERMSNGQASSYIGVSIVDSRESGDEDIPSGMYVKAVEGGSPAYKAGIQPGDIITSIGTAAITSTRAWQSELEKLHAEDSITITIMRNGKGEYTELKYPLVVGAR